MGSFFTSSWSSCCSWSSSSSSSFSILLMQYGQAGYVSTGSLHSTVSCRGCSKVLLHSSFGHVHVSCAFISLFLMDVRLKPP
jgi:hypothetical protein